MTEDPTKRGSVMENELYPPRPAQLAECWIRGWKATYGRWPTKGRWPGRAAGFSLGTYRAVLARLKRVQMKSGKEEGNDVESD